MSKPRSHRIPLPERKCDNEICGKFFVPYRSWQRFCSTACRHDAYWRTHEVVEKDVTQPPGSSAAA